MTRARSLPDRGTEGRGGGGSGSLCRLPRESSRRPRTKLRSQTQTKDPAPCLKPADQDARHNSADRKPDTGNKMAGGAGEIARRRGRGLVTRSPEAPPPDARDVTAWARCPAPRRVCAGVSARTGQAGAGRARTESGLHPQPTRGRNAESELCF